MTAHAIGRPDETEYLPYYGRYVALVPDGPVLDVLRAQLDDTLALLRSVPESREQFRYAPGKWSVRELVGHLIDSERIFAYRALRFARDDRTPLPGYEENDYVAHANFDAIPLAHLAAEFRSVRDSTLFLFQHLDPAAWARRGLANDAEVTVRALAHIIAGHELHHRGILRERYLQPGEAG
ncbi:MAG TPA: DinB family protein [Pyrinomonadaceae bacterium]|nr:DinB family protein [Pyrinomonadaceae bacterium]